MDDKVVAMAVSDTSTEGTWAWYLQKQKVPVIGAFGFSSAVWGKLDNFFTMKTEPHSQVTFRCSSTSGPNGVAPAG